MKTGPNPLYSAFAARLQLLATTLQPGTMYRYRRTARLFLKFMRDRFPEVTRPRQLERDPHLIGWLEDLWSYRTGKGQPLNSATRGAHVLELRTLLESMQDLPSPPKPGLLCASDVPKRQFPLPRPLTPEDDERLCQYWEQTTGPLECALYLMRLTGMRIGECVDLAPDCLRHLGDNRWSIHVPHGKPRSERWVPVEDKARQLVERLAFLRTLPPAADPHYLLARPSGRASLMIALREQLRSSAARAGVTARIVPHQLRHTYATALLRAGVSLPALMRLLGHHNANMTLIYVEVTQQDLHREYQAARQQPRYRAPSPLVSITTELTTPASVLDALDVAIRIIDTRLSATPSAKPLALLRRRLVRVRAELKKLSPDDEG